MSEHDGSESETDFSNAIDEAALEEVTAGYWREYMRGGVTLYGQFDDITGALLRETTTPPWAQ